jgi:hypothetical protein
MNHHVNITEPVENEILFAEAHARVAGELAKLPADAMVANNLDVLGAVATVLGALPEIQEQRHTIAAQLPEFDLSIIDTLQDFALALGHAHTLYVTADCDPDNLPELAEEAFNLREAFLWDVRALTGRGLVNPGALKALSGVKGYKNVAQDLQILVSVLKEVWPLVASRCAATPAEMDRSEKLSMRILRLVGLRQEAPPAMAATAEQRNRAMTALVQRYNEVRRALFYVRWHERDANTIAPSLYASRRKPGSGPAEPEVPPAEPPVVVVAEPVAPGAGSPTTPLRGTDLVRPLVAPSPGNNPFMQ